MVLGLQSHRSSLLSGLALLVLLAACACAESFDDRRRAVDLVASTGATDGEPAVAVGARIGFRATIHGPDSGDGSVTVSSVESDTASVAEVTSTQGAEFTVRGRSAGRARLRVAGRIDGDAFSRSLALDVVDAYDVRLDHRCLDSPVERRYLAGGEVVVGYRLVADDGRTVSGMGLEIARSPTDGAGVDASLDAPGLVRLQLPDASRDVRLTAIRGDASLSFDLVSEEQLDDVTWLEASDVRRSGEDESAGDCDRTVCRAEPGDPWTGVIASGETEYVHPVFRADGALVCQARTPAAIDLSPDQHCRVRWRVPVPRADRVGRSLDWSGALELEARAAGACEFDVQFPETAGPLNGSFDLEIRPVE